MAEEQVVDQEQTGEAAGAQVTPETTPKPSALDDERLTKLESDLAATKGYVTKLEQENSTYRQIITDRGQAASVQTTSPAVTVSEVDKEIEELERKVQSGEITQEELAVKSLRLIRKAKESGKQEAVREVTGLYAQEQELTRSFHSIFEDADLKGLEKDMSDIAYGYMQAGIARGMRADQAANYAKEQTKIKLNTFKSRFSQQQQVPPVNLPKVETPVSGLKGEGEGQKQPPKKEEPVTAEQSQKSFIEMRRAKLAS